MISHFYVIIPCTMAALHNWSTLPLLIELMEAGGFSLQTAALETASKVLRLNSEGGLRINHLAQVLGSIVKQWQKVGPTEHPLLKSWQTHLMACIQTLLSIHSGAGLDCPLKLSSTIPCQIYA